MPTPPCASSPEHVRACLTKLWTAFPEPQLSPQQHTRKAGLYTERLQALDPADLRAATDAAIDSLAIFPPVSRLLKLASDARQEREAAAELERKRLASERDLGSVLRNEVILLLGCYHADARDRAGDGTYREFLAEAARRWGKVRPIPLPAPVADRRTWGTAMEAWARRRLGDAPVHPFYLTNRIREAFLALELAA